jgi:hypothetical protein
MLLRSKKITVSLCIVLLSQLIVGNSYAQTTVGPNLATAGSNVARAGSSTSWLNTENVAATDDVYVSIVLNGLSSSGDYTDFMQATGFGLSIPVESIILGITVEIERADVNNAKDDQVSIVKGGVIGTEDKSLTPAWSSESFIGYGSASDLWSETWTAADINAGNFGVAFAAKKQGGGANPSPLVDNVRISVTYQSTLPIELTAFSVSPSIHGAICAWTTASEVDNRFFTIERSVDGTSWSTLAELPGAGNSIDILNYESLDDAPHSGLSYYRLKQTDFNGSFAYSDIVSLIWAASGKIEGQLFPNPATAVNATTVRVCGFQSNEVMINITNAQGQLMHRQAVALDAECNAILLDRVKALSPGIYVVSMSSDTQSFSEQLVIR